MSEIRAIPEKKNMLREDGIVFLTPSPIELDFHRDKPPIDLETFIYQLAIELCPPAEGKGAHIAFGADPVRVHCLLSIS